MLILKLPYLLFPVLVEDTQSMYVLERSGVFSELVQEMNKLSDNHMSKSNLFKKGFMSLDYFALVSSLTTTVPGLM